MKLLTKEVREKLPLLYSQENEKDPMVICKFFYPDFGWTWYAIEFDGEGYLFRVCDWRLSRTRKFFLVRTSKQSGQAGVSD